MESSTVSKILSALESAGIKEYGVATDELYHLYNNDYGILVNGGSEMYSISRKSQVIGAEPYEGETVVRAFDHSAIVFFEFGGDFKAVEAFLEAAGQSLTDEQKKVLLRIDRTNYTVIPETGDYHPFKELTPEEYEALTPEEKAAYDAAKKDNDQIKSGIHRGFTVRID